MVTTQYPTAIPTTNQCPTGLQNNIDDVLVNQHNPPHAEIIAIATELGILPKGVSASVKARLDAIEALIGANGSVLIEEGYASVGAVANFDFTLITDIYTHLLLIGSLRSEQAADSDHIYTRFNADAGNNYDYIRAAMQGDGGNASSTTERGVSAIIPGSCEGANAQADAFSTIRILISDYANTNKDKSSLSESQLIRDNASDADIHVQMCSGHWNNKNAISRVTVLTNGADNFAQYSKLSLYGIK